MRQLLAITFLAALPTLALAQNGAELRLAKSVLSEAQALSFRNNREYCGYIVLDENGDMRTTKLTKGRKASCLADDFPEEWTPIASFHTHGAHVDGESFEIPSYSDAEGDEEEGVDGYVATPGGRLWYIDSQDREIGMVCGLNCLPADPRFEEYPEDRPPSAFTYEELRRYENEG